MWEAPPLPALQDAVASPSNPIGMRMRAAYFLRQAYDNAKRNTDDGATDGSTIDVSEIVIQALGMGLADKRHGSLMRHEFAYVMGQLRDERCCPVLERTLSDDTDCTMVRHEAAEALGAIGSFSSIPVLETAITLNPQTPEIGETCHLAVEHMKWRASEGERTEEPAACACMISPYSSIDPAPPHPKHANVPTSDLGIILRDPSEPLFERYRAMFSLRNRGGEECVLELGKALTSDTSSALLRHEVAYVLGQMQHPSSVEALAESLRRGDEHEMVRHESAEALGAIEGRWEDCEAILREFLEDEDVVVRESCLVALDAADYWGHGGGGTVGDLVAGDGVCGHDGEADMGPEDTEEKENAGADPLSFVRQKAVTNGRNEEKCGGGEESDGGVQNGFSTGDSKQGACLHHFNVAG